MNYRYQSIHRQTRFRIVGHGDRIFRVVEVGVDKSICLRERPGGETLRCEYKDLIEVDNVVKDRCGNVINRSTSLFGVKRFRTESKLFIKQVEIDRTLVTIIFERGYTFFTKFNTTNEAKRFITCWKDTRGASLYVNGVDEGTVKLKHPALRST